MIVYLIEYEVAGEEQTSILSIHRSFSSATDRASVLANDQFIELDIEDNYEVEVHLDDENEEATFSLTNSDGVVEEAWHIRGVVVED